jgi:hypothetical protein
MAKSLGLVMPAPFAASASLLLCWQLTPDGQPPLFLHFLIAQFLSPRLTLPQRTHLNHYADWRERDA